MAKTIIGETKKEGQTKAKRQTARKNQKKRMMYAVLPCFSTQLK